MMRYMIGYLIKGEAKEYQENLIDSISEEFGTRNLNEHIPAHFTLKSPFETENIGEVEKVLEEFCKGEKKSEMNIGGIGSFNRRVIFIGGEFSEEGLETFRRFIERLREIEWMEFGKHDLEEGNLHSTLARAKDPEQFEEIMKFLLKEKKFFDVEFDNVAILEKSEDGWNVYREFRFG